MPAVAAGIYNAVFKVQAGGSPAESDATYGTGSVDWSGTAVESLGTFVAGLFSTVVEGALTFVGVLRVILASSANKSNGFGVPGTGGTAHIRDVADAKDRIVVGYDANGNRLTSMLDGT
jgi:hypothetical protein